MNRAGIRLGVSLGVCFALSCGGTNENGLVGGNQGGSGGGEAGSSGESSTGGDGEGGDGVGGAGGNEGGSAGTASTGGAPSTGGTPSTGGAPSTGGVPSTGGSGAGGAGGAPALVPCTTSLDCAANPDGTTICSSALGLCVECGGTPDCPANNDCMRNTCVPYQPCATSLDCTLGEVCDAGRGRCVDCITTADCGANEVCSAATCATACDSDNDCTALGQLCNFGTGACVDCTNDAQCAPSEFCEAGACETDACPADVSACGNGGVVTYNSRGDGYLPVAPCGSRESCVAGGSGATCEPWVCTPGATECSDSTTRITCSADGFAITNTVDCSATAEFCSAGACGALVCQPDTDFCDQNQNSVRHCTSDGLSSDVTDACSGSEYCDDADATCKALLCTPNAPVCNGAVATTCNATGTAYSPGGTDCANDAGGPGCANGACVPCDSTTALAGVRIVEVFVGVDDYFVLENRSACSVDLADLTLQVDDTDATAAVNLSMGSFILAPGARAMVGELGSSDATDVEASALIELNYTAGYAMLCAGTCTTAGTPTVVDALSYWNGVTSPPAFPSPVTFSSAPMEGINGTNGPTMAFVRDAFAGTYSTFLASDWSVGDATRPDDTTPPPTCPLTQPTGSCSSFGTTCTYGAVSCTCTFSGVLFSWMCN